MTEPAAEMIPGAIPGRLELRRAPEVKDSKEQVISAFNEGSFIFEATPEDQLTEEQKYARDSVKEAKSKTFDKGRTGYVNSFKGADGTRFRQKEFIPVGDIISFLNTKIESGTLTPEEKNHYEEIRGILIRNSTSYYDFPRRRNPLRTTARVTQELEKVKASPYFNTPKAGETPAELAQRQLEIAADTIGLRRELNFRNVKKPTTAPTPVTPEAAPVVTPPGPTEPVVTTPAQPIVPSPQAEEGGEEEISPTPTDINTLRIEFNFVNRTIDVRKRATELAEEQLRERMRESGFFQRIGLRFTWEYHRQRYIERAMNAMIENNNTYLQMDIVNNALIDANNRINEERKAGIDKIKQINQGVVEPGERVESANQKVENLFKKEIIGAVVKGEIKDGDYGALQQRLREFVETHINDPDTEISSQIANIFGRDATDYNVIADYFATDVFEQAKQVQQDLRVRQFALDRFDEVIENNQEYIKVKLASTNWAADTQTRLNAADRAVAWAQGGRFRGYVFNPAVIGAGFSLLTFTSQKLTGIGARQSGLLVGPVGGAVLGAAFAGVRRYKELKTDITQFDIEKTYGALPPPTREEIDRRIRNMPGWRGTLMRLPLAARAMGAYRLLDFEKLSYDTASTRQLIDGGGIELLNGGKRRSVGEILRDLENNININDAIDRLAEIETRRNISAERKIDLISYSDRYHVEQERLNLTDAVNTLRLTLTGKTTDTQINQALNLWRDALEGNVRRQNREKQIYVLRNAAGSAVFGGVAGFTFGLASQETLKAVGLVSGLSQTPGGIFGKGQTTAESLVGRVIGRPDLGAQPNIDNFREIAKTGGSVDFGDHSRIDVNNNNVSLIDKRINAPYPNSPQVNIRDTGNLHATGNIPNDINNEFQRSGFDVNQGTPIVDTKTILDPSTPHHVNLITGHNISTPDGTHWINDPTAPSKWDLVDSNNRVLVNDAVFDAKGKLLSWLPGASDPDHPLNVDVRETGGPDQVTNGTAASEEFAKNGAKLDHREWYSYDKPGSQGNELRFYDRIKGNGVELDMSHMGLSFQHGLNPNPIDIQQVIKNGEAGWAFSMADHQSLPIWIPDNADGVIDGKLFLDPDDYTHFITLPDGTKMAMGDFAKMVLNADALKTFKQASELFDRRDIFNLAVNGDNGFIEAGRMVDGPNGTKVLQAFATIQGSSGAQITKPGGFSQVFDVTLKEITRTPTVEIIPPSVEAPPIIPFPFAPRHLPEPLIAPEEPIVDILPPVYYGGETLKSLREWIRQKPQRLKPYKKITNPNGTVAWIDKDGQPVRRDINRERTVIQKYLEEKKTSEPGYYAYLESLANIPSIPEMSEKCRVAVNIPAWMEGKNMYRVLEQYTQQVDKSGNKLDTDLYEINVIVNRRTGTPPDETVAEIERFIHERRAKGENYHINYVNVEFDPPLNNVGHARKVITDLTLLRSLHRLNQNGQLYIESEDADLVHIDPKTVINLIDKFDSNPHLDAARGMQDRYPETLMQNDLLFLQRRLWDFTESFLRRKKYRFENNPKWNFTWHRVITGGWNTGYTAEAYALIEGYDSRQTKGEDMTIGEKITMIRGDGDMPNLDVVGKVPTRSDSSPRRFISEILTGKGAYSDAFEDENFNEFIKNASTDELLQRIEQLSRINNTNRGSFAGLFQGHYQSIKNLTPNENEAKELFDTIMFWAGFKKEDYVYKPDGSIEITNWTNLENALNDYRARHPVPRKPGERIGYRIPPNP